MRDLHAQVFGGSYPIQMQDHGDSFRIELSSEATPEQVQQLKELIINQDLRTFKNLLN